MGVGGGAILYLGLPYILEALQLHGEEATLAADFLRPMLVLLTFQVVESAGVACLVGAGDTVTGMLVLGGVAVVNVPLTWLFFHGAGPIPALGFAGIGLGTAVAHTLGGLAVLAVLIRGRAGLRLRPRLIWPNAELIWRLLRVSVPAGLDNLSLTLGHLWFLGIVNRAPGGRGPGRPRHRHPLGGAEFSDGTGVRHGGDGPGRPEPGGGPARPGGSERLDGLRAWGDVDGVHGGGVFRICGADVRPVLSQGGTGADHRWPAFRCCVW